MAPAKLSDDFYDKIKPGLKAPVLTKSNANKSFGLMGIVVRVERKKEALIIEAY